MNLVRAYYGLLFWKQLRLKTGTAYQDFVVNLMELRYPGDFIRVRPWGSDGDQKCDGIHNRRRQLFQIYAPERLELSRARKKVAEDFRGAVDHWRRDFDTWVFIHNQHIGLPPRLTRLLLRMNGVWGKQVATWCDTELEREMRALDVPELEALLGPAIDPRQVEVSHRDIGAVVQNIAGQPDADPGTIRVVPAGKIEANELEPERDNILAGQRRAHHVAHFFSLHPDPEFGDRVARRFREEYIGLRTLGLPPVEIFRLLWQFAGGGTQDRPGGEMAVLAVLAYLFEQCEIFEPAQSNATSN